MPCFCGLGDSLHWFVDQLNAPNLYQVALTPEQAESNLRSWAGKVVKKGHLHLDMRPIAARVLAAKILFMTKICDHPGTPTPGFFE